MQVNKSIKKYSKLLKLVMFSKLSDILYARNYKNMFFL